MPQIAIFGFLNYENNSDIINHLLLIFKYYLFDSREHNEVESWSAEKINSENL